MLAYDGPIYRFLQKISDTVLLHGLWLLASLPIVTIGASTAALQKASMERRLGSQQPLHKLFLSAFRQYALRASALFALLCIVTAWLAASLIFWSRVNTMAGEIALILCTALFVPCGLAWAYSYGVLVSRNTSVLKTLRCALWTAYAHPLQSLRLLIVWGLVIFCNCLTLYTNVMTLFIGFGIIVHVFVTPSLLKALEPERLAAYRFAKQQEKQFPQD